MLKRSLFVLKDKNRSEMMIAFRKKSHKPEESGLEPGSLMKTVTTPAFPLLHGSKAIGAKLCEDEDEDEAKLFVRLTSR